MSFLTKVKQISGLNALLSALALEDIALGGKIGGVTLGAVTLDGNTLRLPFTDGSGTVTTRTVDLTALTTDVNIGSTSLTPEGILTITETDGQTHTIDLLAYVSNYVTTNVLPGIAQLETDVAAQEVRLDAVESDVTAIEGDITTLQGSVDALETGKADALDLYTKGQIDAQEVAQNLLIGQKADASAVYSKTATDNKDTEQNVAVQDVVDDAAAVVSQVSGLDTVVTALEGNRSYVLPDIASQVTTADGQLASNYALPAGVKYATSVLVNGVSYRFGAKTQACYFSKDNGATAVMTDLAGAKLYWNGSKAGMELDADDKIALVVIGKLAEVVDVTFITTFLSPDFSRAPGGVVVTMNNFDNNFDVVLHLERSTEPAGPFTEIHSAAVSTGNDYQYEDTDVNDQTTYFYRVRAVAYGQTSGYSTVYPSYGLPLLRTFTLSNMDNVPANASFNVALFDDGMGEISRMNLTSSAVDQPVEGYYLQIDLSQSSIPINTVGSWQTDGYILSFQSTTNDFVQFVTPQIEDTLLTYEIPAGVEGQAISLVLP